MPTIDDVTKVLNTMDAETYSAAVKYIFFLADSQEKKSQNRMENQRKFIEETAGKITVDEEAITKLRMGSMI